MPLNTYHHSIRLNRDKCKGCTNCIKHCPTEAIRVREGKAQIIDQRCIDCGECLRICPYHAKEAHTTPMSRMDHYRYRIALPAPSLYGQFKGITNAGWVLEGLLRMGFDDVYEVARGADIISDLVREHLRHADKKPLISSACPVIVRLIQVRFPDLIENLVPFVAPMEAAAMIARDQFCQKTGADPADVGVFFITPCAAKVTAIQNPVGTHKSAVSGAISIMDVYGFLAEEADHTLPGRKLRIASGLGIGWASSGGESAAIGGKRHLVVDGIQNVIEVLEEIDNDRFSDLAFLEGQACIGGCVGGPLTFANAYIAKNRIRRLAESPDVAERAPADPDILKKYPLALDQEIEYRGSVMRLDSDLGMAIQKWSKWRASSPPCPAGIAAAAVPPAARPWRRTSSRARRWKWIASSACATGLNPWLSKCWFWRIISP